ncbi:hypothetical protein AGLY_017461 [Aphis glycines]|uniref:DDE Tnp4 domain-containing protein n=1 Tax=Aphis glycines TaxID=307491 RepID=A0A6G0SWX8_APHGL|nr:hypothetical protein AGLY_017461 [Aphis glycines]
MINHILPLFNECINKLQGNNISVMVIYDAMNSLKKSLEIRIKDLNWLKQVKCVNLSSELKYSELLNLISELKLENKLFLNMNELYDECNRINEMLPLLKEPNSNSCNKWQSLFKIANLENNNFYLKNIYKVVSFIYSIPATSSYCERVFSMMNLKYRDERNKCRLELIKYELIITLNAKETCTEIYDTFLKDEKLLKAAKTMGDCFSSLAALYRIPKNSISVFPPEVCASICESLSEYIKVPNIEDDWKKIQNEFYTRWNFTNCVGAVDGKHILIRCPKNTGSEYFNYKHSFSVILLAVINANYCFSYIDIGTNGRVNDARVFSKSSFYEALENKTLKIPSNGVFVVDDAFPLRNGMLKP